MARRRNKRLFILRGLPGAGKTKRARQIVAGSDGEIFSTDDYFIDEHGNYNFDKNQMQARHRDNRERVLHAITRRVDPIVVDNTNLRKWEMWPYVRMAFRRRYLIIFEDVHDVLQADLLALHRRCRGNITLEQLREKQEAYQPVRSFWRVLFDAASLNKWMPNPERIQNRW